jgi:hypothetical protein
LAKPTAVKPAIRIGQVTDVPAESDSKMFQMHVSLSLYKNSQIGLSDNQLLLLVIAPPHPPIILQMPPTLQTPPQLSIPNAIFHFNIIMELNAYV